MTTNSRNTITTRPRIGQELLDVPMGDMIRQMAFAIADAQTKLDANSIEVAEMMGGLKTITDDDGNVTFEDSRVYFGKEKTTLQSAIELHNLSNDFQLRASIRQALGDSNYEATNLITTPAIVSLAALVTAATVTSGSTPVTEAQAAVYKDSEKIYQTTNNSSVKEYYKYAGMMLASNISTPTYQKVSQYSYLIKAKGSLAPQSSISIPQRMSMLELGFTPTFYQFVDTIIEVKISIKYTQEASSRQSSSQASRNSSGFQVGGGLAKLLGAPGVQSSSVSTSQVNASYSQKYSYSAEGSSLLRTKLVPIPPPAILEDRIRKMMEAEFENAEVPVVTA